MTETFRKLVDARIELLPVPEIQTHFVFHRDGFAALVERVHDRFGRVGTAGLLTEKGIAPLQWKGKEAFFTARDFRQPANLQQVESLRDFQKALAAALAT